MIWDGSEGISDQTPRKQSDLRYILSTGFAVHKAIQNRRRWADPTIYHFDLTAGSGIVNGEPGSPVIFWEEAKAAGMSCRAWFCERDKDSAHRLQSNLKAMGADIWCRSRVLNMDYKDGLAEILGALSSIRKPDNQWKYGLLYVDPNGTILDGVETIGAFLSALPRIDVLVNVAATTYKRCRKAFADEERPYLTDHLALLGKKFLHVREPYHHFQWAFCLGTNWADHPEFRSRGFYDVRSLQGAKILQKLDLTTREREEGAVTE